MAERLRQCLRRRHFCGLGDGPAALALPESERARILAEADNAIRGWMHVAGLGQVDCGDPIDWYRDPVSGRRFPTGIFDLARDPAIDWKFRDEINLHRHFYPLAQAYYLTGATRFAAAALCQLTSWLESNPAIGDRYWYSPLQCAIRVTAWVWLLHLLAQPDGLGIDQEAEIVDAICQQARFIERHTQPPPHSYNHLIGEAAALALVGVALPYLHESNRWRENGLDILAREATRQFGREGGHCEQSLGYHVFALEAYTHVVVLCRQNGVDVDPRTTKTLERMYEFAMHVMRPDGMLPHIGDEGLRWHQLSRGNLRDCRRLLSTGAVLFDRPDMKWIAGAFGPESEWLLGREGRVKYEALQARPPSSTSVCLPDTGLAVWRSGWGPLDHYLVVDTGPQGIGRAGHGHADALSIEVFANGAPLIVDAGTYTYNTTGEWRRYFRGTAAHNTIRVDSQDQAEPKGADPFFWERTANARLRRWCNSALLGFIDGSHDGYQRLAQQVEHRRLIFWAAREYWLICDILTGLGTHSYESFFHFPPGRVSLDENRKSCTVGDTHAGLRIVPFAGGEWCAEIVCGESNPSQGWLSNEYGHREPAPVLTYRRSGSPPVMLAAVLLPVRGPLSPRVSVSRVDVYMEHRPVTISEAGCIRVAIGDDLVDHFLWSDHPGEKVAGQIATESEVAFLRLRAGEPRAACFGGGKLQWRGEDVLSGRESLHHAEGTCV